jgi:hypothetical protein
MTNAWSRHAAELALTAALLIGGVFYGVSTHAQAPVVTPLTADGKPDLSGIWVPTTRGGGVSKFDEFGSGEQVYPSRDGSFENFENDNALRRLSDRNKPLYKPEFWGKVRENDTHGNELDPEFKCRPYGVPRMGAPSQIVQTKDMVILLYAGGFASQNPFRVIPTDGRPHNQARVAQETWRGDSVGHWEGNTLVIDTIGFTDENWLHKSGYFHSFKLHVVERLTREGNRLRWEATVEDPEVLLEPWKMNPIIRALDARPDAFVPEDLPCEERDREHLVSKVRSG